MYRRFTLSFVSKVALITLSSIALMSVGDFAHAAPCTNSYASGASAPVGYAPAWNPLTAARELLVQGTECTTSTATVKVGSGAQTQLVYNKGYFYTGSAWQQYTLTGTTPLQSNAWYTGSAAASIQLPQSVTYVVGYVCQQQGSAWKCGCRDSTCATSYWQLQAVKGAAAEPPSTGGGGTGDTGGAGTGAGAWTSALEAPPTMDAGYVLVQNICPGEAGWPTDSMVAGKDVKIVMPTNRECKPSSDTAAIQGTASNPVKDVWIVGGVLRRAGFSFRNYSGTVFIEGALIDLQGHCQDAINGYFGRGDGGRWVVQNTHITGVHYCIPGTHGDTTHPQGSGAMLKELKYQNVWGHVVLQGLFIVPRYNGPYPGHGVKKLTFDHVFLQADPNHAYPGKKIATMLYWEEQGVPVDGVHFKDSYLKWWGGKDGATKNMRRDISIPYVASYDSAECATYAPAAKVTGKWCAGDPPGVFVPLDKIGLNYQRSYFTNN